MGDRATQDRRLVEAVLHGDDAAYGELVQRYQNMVGSVAWRYGARRDEVEDMVSEVFIKAYGNLSKYRPDHAFSTWLYRLAANHVLDNQRKKKKERGRTEMPEQMADDGPGPGQRVEREERAELLRSCMSELPDHYREVLHVVYVDAMKVDDAARALGIPQGTVKTRLMRGREALRKVLVRRHPEYFAEGAN